MMQPIAMDVTHTQCGLCVFLCLCRVDCVYVQKRMNRSRCRWGLTLVGLRNDVIYRGQDQTNPLAVARGDKTAMAMWPMPNYFVHLLIY